MSAESELPLTKMCIAGEWTDSDESAYVEVENPATGKSFARIALSSEKQIDAAIESAAESFRRWSRLSPEKRAAILYRAADLVRERADEIARLMTKESGKPFNEARGEVTKAADILQFYSEEGKRVHGERIPGFDPTTTSYVVYEPVGVAAAISPWNYPVELVGWKLGGALAAGCPIVIKPPTETPLSPTAYAACVIDAGVPPGVVNIVLGRGSTVGPLLIEDPRVKKVAFTGSTEAGKQVAAQCGRHMKKVSLELGGHCPLIVSEHADMEHAVKGATRRTFRNMGQICIAVNRIYVHRSRYAEFLEKFVAATSRLTIADGLKKPDADLGPMASKEGIEKTKRHVEDAISRGATLSCGGEEPAGPAYEAGYFYKPTILSGVNHDMLIMQEETFGPAVGVMPYDTVEEAIERANDTEYGLAAYVYTDDLHEADRFTMELEAGNVSINNPDAGVINAPYGGFKQSGMGYEHGRAGMMEYLKAKHVRTRYYRRNEA